jgi:hypothetical protein
LSAAEERFGGEHHAALPDHQAHANRVRPEGGEERADDHARFQAAQHADVELGYPPAQHEQAVSLPDPELPEDVGEAVGEPLQFRVSDRTRAAVALQAAERDPCRERPRGVAVDRLVRDVERAARQSFELALNRFPRKRHACSVSTGQIRRHAERCSLANDKRSRHVRLLQTILGAAPTGLLTQIKHRVLPII